MSGDWASARPLYDEALALLESLGEVPHRASLLASLANNAERRGDNATAVARAEEALGLARRIGADLVAAEALGVLANVASAQGEKARALQTLEEALALRRKAGRLDGTANLLRNQGLIHLSRREFALARAHFEEALALSERLGEGRIRTLCLGDLATVALQEGDLARALHAYERALGAAEEDGNLESLQVALQDMATVYGRLDREEQALPFLERALALARRTGDRVAEASTLYRLSACQFALGRLDEAEQSALGSLALREEMGDARAAAKALGALALIAWERGDLDRAEAIAEKQLDRYRQDGDDDGAALVLLRLAGLRLDRGDVERAVELARRANELAERSSGARVLIESRFELARMLAHHRDHAAVLEVTRRAVELQARTLRWLGQEQGATARQSEVLRFDPGFLAALRLRDADAMAFLIEHSRAIGLAERLRLPRALHAELVAPEVLAAEREALDRAAQARADLHRAGEGGDRATLGRLRSELEAAERRASEARDRVERAAGLAADLVGATPATLQEIQGSLGPDEAYVAYVLTLQEIVALVVTPAEARVVHLGPDAQLGPILGGLGLDGPRGEWREPLEALRRALWIPLALPSSIRRVCVSPDGAICLVPFALFDPDVTVAYAPSATARQLLARQAFTPGSLVLAVGDPTYGSQAAPAVATLRSGQTLAPLPGTREEARSVGDRVLVGGDATKARLFAALGEVTRWRAVHLACHGLFDAGEPGHSALALTPEAGDDGLLTVGEVLSSSFPADLVVLSACETARGERVEGEGLVGLTRAFLCAGTPRVLSSLWKVDDDATRALMTRFYQLWTPKDGTPGLTPVAALREAQRFVRSHEAWEHPYYWAAWVLWGRPE
jgi:tetratricopeptide (TPR) repeat protein